MKDLLQNETMRSILDRRSIRVYKDAQITEQQRDTIIEAALQSPSARNAQPCQVRIVQNRELMKEFNADLVELDLKKNRPGPFGPDYSFYFSAPTFIFIFGDASNDWSPVDSGIMAENIALSAHSLGLGSVIIGMANPVFKTEARDKWRKLLQVPDGYELVVSVAVGVKDANPDPKPRDASRFVIL
jgi:nitroreductase